MELINSTQIIIPTTSIDYLGSQMSMDNREFLDNLNERYNLIIEPKEIPQVQSEQNKFEIEKFETEQAEKMGTHNDIPKNVKLNQVMVHNIVQTIPTQEIMKLMSSKS